MNLKKHVNKKTIILTAYAALTLVIVIAAIGPTIWQKATTKAKANPEEKMAIIQNYVFPPEGKTIKVNLTGIGKMMVKGGVIDEKEFTQSLTNQESLPDELKKYFTDEPITEITINHDNASFWLNFLWGLGLANKNDILDIGTIVQYGDPYQFASTGGWSVGKKDVKELFSKFSYVKLTSQQQKLLEETASKTYRPCCDNPTSFPDCNHGMAMLAMMELLASQNYQQPEIMEIAAQLNAYWFPDNYLTMYYDYYTRTGVLSAPPEAILSKEYSSASGYKAVAERTGYIEWPIVRSLKGCGV